MRITSKGQVTIPQEIRERFGLLPATEVEFVAKRNSVHIVKSTTRQGRLEGETIVRRLRGRSSVGMSTDEILALTQGVTRKPGRMRGRVRIAADFDAPLA